MANVGFRVRLGIGPYDLRQTYLRGWIALALSEATPMKITISRVDVFYITIVKRMIMVANRYPQPPPQKSIEIFSRGPPFFVTGVVGHACNDCD